MMIALHRLGRAAEALRTHRRYRELNKFELGLEPSAQLKQVELAILRGDEGPGYPGNAAVRPRPVALPATSFVGRDDDMAVVDRMLADAPLVTIVGPGGFSKTRLALEVVRHAGERYPEGVLVCELAGVTDRDGLFAAAADTVLEAGASVERQLTDPLAHRPSSWCSTAASTSSTR